nr:2Fe-2S iron-sulfur cluster binding domain-containing protein [Nostocaceae cyanobacterium]
ESLQTGLKEWGVPKERIFQESFNVSKASVDSQSSGEDASQEVEESEIVFASDKTLTWHDDDGTILEFALANGLNPPNSCRQGVCGTCMCKISEGSVAYQISPTAEIDEGSVLICISKPATPKVVLDI